MVKKTKQNKTSKQLKKKKRLIPEDEKDKIDKQEALTENESNFAQLSGKNDLKVSIFSSMTNVAALTAVSQFLYKLCCFPHGVKRSHARCAGTEY